MELVQDRGGVEAWLDVPQRVFAGDPNYILPLRMEERRRFARKRNPFFRFAEAAMFVAFDPQGVPVGRISAQVNHRYLEQHRDDVGHFGFFETIDDPGVSEALLSAAAQWLAARGLRRMEGPFSFSINEECGLLVEGFETPPAIMMAHSRRWQSLHLERFGFLPVMDLHAFRFDPFALPKQLEWLSNRALSDGRISVRSLKRRCFKQELALMTDIFNDAWQDNWGFVPFDAAEIDYMMSPLRPFFRERYAKFAYFDGEPIGFTMILPNINDMIKDFDGRLLPYNWLRVTTKLLRGQFDSARMPLLGLRRSHQGGARGAQLFAAMLHDLMRDSLQLYRRSYAARHGHTDGGWTELSWVLASNRPLITFLRQSIGSPAKTYRIYGKELAS